MSLIKTGVPYATHNWAVVQGCNGPVNPKTGEQERCFYCYLDEMKAHYGASMAPTFHPEHLADPLRRKKPAVICCTFGGDLFDRAITDEQIAAVFGVPAASPQHTFLIPTKQAARMRAWFGWLETLAPRWPGCPWDWQCSATADAAGRASGFDGVVNLQESWPLPNVWLGASVTCEADTHRLDDLCATPAAHRWVSYGPAIGPVDFAPWLDRIDLVIMEGMSGRHAGAFPMDLDWARSTRDACAAAGVGFYLKQLSGRVAEKHPMLDGVRHSVLPWGHLLEGGQ